MFTNADFMFATQPFWLYLILCDENPKSTAATPDLSHVWALFSLCVSASV